jgi:hypothetical protein
MRRDVISPAVSRDITPFLYPQSDLGGIKGCVGSVIHSMISWLLWHQASADVSTVSTCFSSFITRVLSPGFSAKNLDQHHQQRRDNGIQLNSTSFSLVEIGGGKP